MWNENSYAKHLMWYYSAADVRHNVKSVQDIENEQMEKNTTMKNLYSQKFCKCLIQSSVFFLHCMQQTSVSAIAGYPKYICSNANTL